MDPATCDVCHENGITTLAKYQHNWIKVSPHINIDAFINVCEEHIMRDVDKNLLSRGYTLKITGI